MTLYGLDPFSLNQTPNLWSQKVYKNLCMHVYFCFMQLSLIWMKGSQLYVSKCSYIPVKSLTGAGSDRSVDSSLYLWTTSRIRLEVNVTSSSKAWCCALNSRKGLFKLKELHFCSEEIGESCIVCSPVVFVHAWRSATTSCLDFTGGRSHII